MAFPELAYTRIADIVSIEEAEELWALEDELFKPEVDDVSTP